MPTYTYACTDCGERFEAVQSIHDSSLTECPACGGTVRRVISAVGVSFKGSGFYRTDSRAGSGKGSDAGKSSGASKESGASKGGAKDSGSSSKSSTKESGGSTSGGTGSGGSGSTSAGASPA